MRRTLLLLTVLAGLAACGKKEPEIILPTDSCGAIRLQGLVGQPAEVLETIRFTQPVRVVQPGQAVTMDFSPNRLTIETNEAGRIVRIACG
ncbi:I78 family peptidase inhibitor [Rhodobacter sp. NSM]|uniref:I78 family peptidase inhibitor n=1 Tax=Rhodobacter sp. NSM TaxID=3457501 RepID=UPI003FD2B98E